MLLVDVPVPQASPKTTPSVKWISLNPEVVEPKFRYQEAPDVVAPAGSVGTIAA